MGGIGINPPQLHARISLNLKIAKKVQQWLFGAWERPMGLLIFDNSNDPRLPGVL